MKRFTRCAMIVALVGLVGCLPFGLGDPEKSKSDDRLVGLWMSAQKDGDQSLWSVSNYDSRTMLVTYYGFKRNGDAIEPSDRGNYKLWITPIGGKQFLTMEVIGTSRIMKSESDVFLSAAFEISGTKLSARGINADAVKKAGIDSAEKLTKYVGEHISDAEMYIDEMTYEKVAKDNADVTKVFEAFHE